MSTIGTPPRTITLSRTDSAGAASRVRHVDELNDAARERFYDLLASESSTVTAGDGTFRDGEVIVFTDYYRVTLV